MAGPLQFITDHSKVVVLLRFLLPAFGVRVSMTFHFTRVYIIFRSTCVAEWPHVGK